MLKSSVEEWVQRIRSEYVEMPGLSLTRLQMCRLWRIDPPTCEAVVDRLVATVFLRRRPDDSYVRVGGGA